jgi:hypothetical protein
MAKIASVSTMKMTSRMLFSSMCVVDRYLSTGSEFRWQRAGKSPDVFLTRKGKRRRFPDGA